MPNSKQPGATELPSGPDEWHRQRGTLGGCFKFGLYIDIYINEIYNYTIISMCMYVYIYIYIYIYQENRSVGTLFASSEQCCWTDHT